MSRQKRIAIGGGRTKCSTYSHIFLTIDDLRNIEGNSLVELLAPYLFLPVRASNQESTYLQK